VITAGALLADYAAGHRTPSEVVAAALERLASQEPALNAFAHVRAEAALAEAATKAIRAGAALPPLHGIPVAVKDLVEIAGEPTGWGTRARPPEIARRDATLVARLRAAGAIIIGKTNLLEFAYGVAHPDIGQTNNPHDPSRTAGGSSGGSAAAVAAGIVPMAVGTDTGGSIRIPAAYCGIVGMKPSYGLVPLRGVFPLSWSLDHAGPLAASVDDAARMLAVLSGRPIPLFDRTAPRLGVLDQHFGVDPQNAPVREATEAALAKLAAAGAKIVRLRLPGLDAANAALVDILRPEASVIHDDLIRANRAGYAPGTAAQIEAGFELPAVALVRARQAQAAIRAEVDRALTKVDALVSPSVPFVAPHEDPDITAEGDSEMLASGFANLTGHPSVSLPSGKVGQLPVGLQLTGRRGADAALLSIAKWIETWLT